MSADSIWEQRHKVDMSKPAKSVADDIDSGILENIFKKVDEFANRVQFRNSHSAGTLNGIPMSGPMMGFKPSIMECLEYRDRLISEVFES